MSNPLNPLDKFRTYSYHHFMIAANNTEILRRIESKEISFNSLVGLKHGEMVVNSSGTPGVVMILNSAVDSKFYIDSFDYTTFFNKSKTSEQKLTQASTMKMIIRESGGATFLNFLRKVSDEILQTSYSNVCFMIITFFIGHDADGTTHTLLAEVSPKPIVVTMTNMDSAFDHTGGTHTLSLVGMSNGAPLHMPSILYVNRNLNLTTNDNSILLKDMIADLEGKLNKQLEEQYNSVKSSQGVGRKAKYKITLPEDWSHYTIKCTTKDNYVEKLFDKEKKAVAADNTARAAAANENKKNKVGPESDRFKSYTNTAVKTTVVQVLNEIFKHCDQIHQALVDNMKLTKDQIAAGDLPRLHQIVTSLTSDEQLVTIHFDVLNYYLPRVATEAQKEAITNKTKNMSQAQKQQLMDQQMAVNANVRHTNENQSGIVFEYLFTGMNSDIIQFDIKANQVNTLFQTNRPGISKATREAINPASNDPAETNNIDKKTTSIIPLRKYDTVFLPELAAEAQHGYVYASPESAKLRDDYVMMLARLTALTSSSSHLVIRGNPVFLNQTIREIFPHDDTAYEQRLAQIDADAKTKAKNQKSSFDPTQETSAMASVPNNIPMFARVVIKTPIIDEKSGAVSYEEFWYQGYYNILQIENKFANGEFTQELYIKPYYLNDLDTQRT